MPPTVPLLSPVVAENENVLRLTPAEWSELMTFLSETLSYFAQARACTHP